MARRPPDRRGVPLAQARFGVGAEVDEQEGRLAAVGVGGEERAHDVRADIGGNAEQERGGLARRCPDRRRAGAWVRAWRGMNGALPMCSPGSPQSRCIMVMLPVGDRKSLADPGLFQQPGEHCGNLLGDGLLQRVRAVAVFFPFRFVADAADDVRAVGRLGVVFAACRDHALRAVSTSSAATVVVPMSTIRAYASSEAV